MCIHMGWTCAQVVIGRLVAEEDPAWASRMDDEVQKGKNAMANTSMLRSRQALAELSMQKDTTVKDMCVPCRSLCMCARE
jgi:hypothetical protein